MSDRGLFQGDLVRLAAVDPARDAETFSSWYIDSEFPKLVDSRPARPLSTRYWEKALDEADPSSNTSYLFAIRTLESWVELDDIEWPGATGWLGIGIGAPGYWNRGYGTDAMKVLIRFAFLEVQLHRLNLNVFEYNERAVHLYQKLGFQVEGRVKNYLQRDGRTWDVIFMGLLRPEWREP
jgi:RimJ/RimL family protein N-acetyltransferase